MACAIIPARGGSKRIARKNIREFCGQPMISWVISAAQNSGKFERIIVSTDDAEIAEIARSFGAEVPSLRAENLSDDITPVSTVVTDAITQFSVQSDIICLLFATAAGLIPEDISQGIEKLQSQSDADFCLGVTEFPHPIQRRVRLDDGVVVSIVI